MSVKVEKLENNMAKLTIEVSAEKLEDALQKAFNKQKNSISVPGFRKGKVPRQMVEKMYGPEVFFDEACNILIPTEYEAALDECEEDIVSRPEITVENIKKGEPFVFSAKVALKPPVKLGKYKGITVEKTDATVTDEDVDKALERERQNNARNIEVTDRAVKNDDMVILDFEGFVDGVAFDGGKGENHPLTIGSKTFIPGFEDQLIGAEIGKETEVKVTFPEDYQAEELAGKDAVFKCTIKEIKEKELPELDDEFASEVSEFDTLDEFKADIRKNLEESKAKEAKDEKEAKVIEAIVKDADMDIPEAMIVTQQEQMVDEFAQRMSMQGLSMEQYYQFTGSSEDKLMDSVRPQAEERIKSRFVLEAIAKEENIEATEADVEDEMKKMAEVYQMEVEKIKAMLPAKSLEGIKEDIKVRKAADFVVDNAKEK